MKYIVIFVCLMLCLSSCSSDDGQGFLNGSGEDTTTPINRKPLPTKPTTPTKPTVNKTETVTNPTYANGDRAHFRFSKTGAAYGNNIKVFFDGTLEMTVPSGAVRKELPNGTLWKPESDSNGKLVILGPRSKKINNCTIHF